MVQTQNKQNDCIIRPKPNDKIEQCNLNALPEA